MKSGPRKGGSVPTQMSLIYEEDFWQAYEQMHMNKPKESHAELRKQWNGKSGPECNIQVKLSHGWCSYTGTDKPDWAPYLEYRLSLSNIREQWNGKSGSECNIQYQLPETGSWCNYDAMMKPSWHPENVYRVNPDPHFYIRTLWNGKSGRECNIQIRGSLDVEWFDFQGVGTPGWHPERVYRVNPDPHFYVRTLWNGKSGRECNIEYLSDISNQWVGYQNNAVPSWSREFQYRVVEPKTVESTFTVRGSKLTTRMVYDALTKAGYNVDSVIQ